MKETMKYAKQNPIEFCELMIKYLKSNPYKNIGYLCFVVRKIGNDKFDEYFFSNQAMMILCDIGIDRNKIQELTPDISTVFYDHFWFIEKHNAKIRIKFLKKFIKTLKND
jgi:hypothetical protein